MSERITRVAVSAAEGRARLTMTTGLLAPRIIRTGETSAEVALVATSATLLGGDRVQILIEVGPGLRLDLRDIAGTVAYDGRGSAASWDVAITVAPRGLLVWHSEPLVVSEGALVTRSLTAEVAAEGRLLLRDTVVLGRTGERPGTLTCRTRMTYGDRAAYVEDLHLDDESTKLPGILDHNRVVDTITALGWRPPPDPGAAVLQLAQPGSVARHLTSDAHLSALPQLWHAWQP